MQKPPNSKIDLFMLVKQQGFACVKDEDIVTVVPIRNAGETCYEARLSNGDWVRVREFLSGESKGSIFCVYRAKNGVALSLDAAALARLEALYFERQLEHLVLWKKSNGVGSAQAPKKK